jgi:hypothetical protein
MAFAMMNPKRGGHCLSTEPYIITVIVTSPGNPTDPFLFEKDVNDFYKYISNACILFCIIIPNI